MIHLGNGSEPEIMSLGVEYGSLDLACRTVGRDSRIDVQDIGKGIVLSLIHSIIETLIPILLSMKTVHSSNS